MSQPTKAQVHIDKVLTNISVGYIQDTNEFIADRIFPIVPVNKQSDKYFTYDKEAFARDQAEKRSGAEESAGGGYKVGTGNYYCDQYSFHKDVPPDIEANTDAPLNAFRDATDYVTRAMLIKREKDFVSTFFKTSVWDTDVTLSGTDQWSDFANSDPIDDIVTAIRTAHQASLNKPNTMVLGPLVYDKLKEHPDIVDRVKYTSRDNITADMLAAKFDLDRVLVGEAVSATNVEGATTSLSYSWGKHALLVYSAPRPSLLMPSGGYIFNWNTFGNNFGARINRFPMQELNNAERVEGDMAYDLKVVSAECGYFIENAVA